LRKKIVIIFKKVDWIEEVVRAQIMHHQLKDGVSWDGAW
jgi:hypothetical protein